MENVIKNRPSITAGKVGDLAETESKIRKNKFVQALAAYFRELKSVYETHNFAAALP